MDTRKPVLIGIVIAVAVAVALYFLGVWQGKRQVLPQKQLLEKQCQELQGKLGVAEHTNHLLRARIALSQASLELDRRNFGNAQGRLQEAAAALGIVEAAVAGIDKAKMDALRQQVAGTGIVVAVDLEAQRKTMIELERLLDEILPGKTPPLPPSPTSPAAPAK